MLYCYTQGSMHVRGFAGALRQASSGIVSNRQSSLQFDAGLTFTQPEPLIDFNSRFVSFSDAS